MLLGLVFHEGGDVFFLHAGFDEPGHGVPDGFGDPDGALDVLDFGLRLPLAEGGDQALGRDEPIVHVDFFQDVDEGQVHPVG